VIRSGRLAGLLAVTAVLAGCGSAGPSAATVNGEAIPRSDFEADLDALAGLDGVVSQPVAQNGSYAGDDVRFWLGVAIENELKLQEIAAAGESVTEQDRTAAEQGLASDFGDFWTAAPERARSTLTDIVATDSAFARTLAVDPAEMQAIYEERPADTGAVCLRHILVETEQEANDVVDELASGVDFAALAVERSTEPAAAETGGALTNQDGTPCIPVATFESGYDPQFVAGALEAVPGTPTDPVESSFGWHVILARPFDEVGEDVVAKASAAGRPEKIAELREDAEITTDPRYGRWDAELGGMVPS
jgi:parvulin-like peptidyl-prolyl isomerase